MFTNSYTPPAPDAILDGSFAQPYDLNSSIPVPLLLETERVLLVPFVPALHAEPFAAAQQLVPEARRAGITTCEVVVPGGGHTFDVFSRAFSDSLPWIAGRLGAGPPVTGCPAPSS